MKRHQFYSIAWLIAGMSLAAVLPGWAQENPAPEVPAATAGGAVTEATPQAGADLAGFFFNRLGAFLKSENVFFPGKPGEGPGQKEDDGKVTLNFNNADINQILKFLSDTLGKPILKTDEVNGNITLMMPDPLPKEEAVRKVETALALRNITIVEADGMLLALTVDQALKAGIEIKEGAIDAHSTRLERRILQLQYADATRIKEIIAPLLADPNRIIADPRTNQLIVSDTGINIARIAEIVKQLDRQDEATKLVTQIVKLNYASARQLENALEDLLRHINSGGVGTGGRDRQDTGAGIQTRVFADDITNSLIVSGTASGVETVLEYIKQIDRSTTEGMEYRTFKLLHTDARELATELTQILMTSSKSTTRPVIIADAWTNSLLVTGFPDDIRFVDDLVTQLDHIKTSERDTRVYVLKHADAAVLSVAITQVLGPQDSGNYWSRWNRSSEEDKEIKIYEDLRLNALIISARKEDFGMIEDLIQSLDVELDEGKEEPRVFPLEYADATSLATILEDLFEDETQNRWWSYYGETQRSAVSSLAGKVRVIADPVTNSLIVISSTPRAFDIVQNLLKDLDRVAEFGSTFVVSLKNANAAELATYLTELFRENNQNSGGGRGAFWFLSSAFGGEREISNLIGNVRVVAEPRTNSLLITTQQQNYQSIKELIDKLDQATAQVLVEILIVEMSASDRDDLGIQWGVVGGTPGKTEIGTTGSGNRQNFESVAGAALNRWNYSALSTTQFNVVLNYLAAESKANVIARPNIMTSNNKPAIVRLVQDFPYVENAVTTSNTTSFAVDYKEVGLVLSVTPQVNIALTEGEEKRVTLEVTLTNGEALNNATPLSFGTTPLQAFSRREVTTKVTVNDQMTVVLSGVLDESEVDNQDGVPGLRKIPLLGGLFKSHSRSKEKTELVTFITPYILLSPNDLQSVTDKQMNTDAYKYYMEKHSSGADIGMDLGSSEIIQATGPVDIEVENTQGEPKPSVNDTSNQRSVDASRKRSAMGRRNSLRN